jgi:predicted DNA-binding transcriptional regulator YafY
MITRKEFFQFLGLGALLPGHSAALAGNDLWSDPHWLQKWQQAPRVPILVSADEKTTRLLTAIRAGNSLMVRYFGGSTPGRQRLISPAALYKVQGFSSPYLTAHCHTKNQPRHFRLDLLEVGRQPV